MVGWEQQSGCCFLGFLRVLFFYNTFFCWSFQLVRTIISVTILNDGLPD
jgi:hypothetical protein